MGVGRHVCLLQPEGASQGSQVVGGGGGGMNRMFCSGRVRGREI